MPSAAVDIVRGYQPGTIGRVAELHATYYHRHWDFGLFFEAKVATELSAFLQRYDETRDGLWTARTGGRIVGAIVLDGRHAATDGAHLRWFIVSEAVHGQGAGRALLESAVGFGRRKRYGRVFLWTFEGLHTARHLYESVGFRLVRQQEGVQWGKTVVEQYFVLETD